jgi:anti-sigma regulatory factor (Ser/Thr protein kinase)
MRSDPKLLFSLRGLVRSYLGGMGFDEEKVGEIVLAIDEACANSIRHAYGGREDGRIDIVFRSTPEELEITLSDEGTPAPREKLAKKELGPADPATITPGGLGIQLMYAVFDEVRFAEGLEKGNQVTMVLKRPGGAQTQAAEA